MAPTPEPTEAEFHHYARRIIAWRDRQRLKAFLVRRRRGIAVLAVAFFLAWFFRYEPMGNSGYPYVWDHWTHRTCLSALLSQGYGCRQ